MVPVDRMRTTHLWAHVYIAYAVLRKSVKDLLTRHERLHTARLHLARRRITVALPPVYAQPAYTPLVWLVHDEQPGREVLTGNQFRPEPGRAMALPQVILLDLDIQSGRGRDTLQRLQAIIAYHRLSITVLTTSNAQLDDEMSLGLGAEGFLVRRVKQAMAVIKLQKAASYDKALRRSQSKPAFLA